MSAGGTAIREILLRFKARRRGYNLAGRYAGNEPPLRSELFSADQMRQHGRHLAASHELLAGSTPDRLLHRLAENEDVLIRTRNLMAAAVSMNRRIAPAGEWLLDNFYLIEEQIRTAKRHLPHDYSRGLPRLAHGPSAGLPRVYDIALEAISHCDGRVDPEGLSSFLAAYQTVAALTLGELWAIPIMLRLALIENLRRAGTRLAADKIDRNRAGYWADRMIEISQRDPKNLILIIADMARSRPPMVSSFVAELARRLQGQSSALALPLTWVEQRLSESGLTIQQLVQMENQQQAVDQVSVSNSIGSLRFLAATDWREFVETMSVVEQTLRRDPAGIYGRMDFATRDYYRHVVEAMAKSSALSESGIADAAVRLAQEDAAAKSPDDRRHHVGFYLVGPGLPQLERAARTRPSTAASLRRAGKQYPLLLYLGTITLFTAIFTTGLLIYAHGGTASAGLLALTGIAALLATSQLAVTLVNRLATLLTEPHPLPRMDFTNGIPEGYRTLVVVPALLGSAQDIEELVEALEVRFLANQDENLHFGLLTDFQDASRETLPEDEPLLLLASQQIAALNDKYSGGKDNVFFLFHRPRRWNGRQGVWMGHERKRGKLADLNALLRAGAPGDADGRFSLIVGKTAVLPTIRYVITLDADTRLPRDAARQLAGTMAHPLNRPRSAAAETDEAHRRRVIAGYGILQPRVAVSLPATARSRYAQLYGDDPGIDPYTRAVSDVYQDVFGEGSFIGKGIYDVDAFEQALGGRFPENRILSHDLLEGCYARAGLLSDVQLYEEYPCRYSADVKRRRRWIRGDWQLAAWLLPRVPGPGSRWLKNPLSGLSRWKIFDNLRRSLVSAALMVLLTLGWIVLDQIRLWTLVALGIVLIPPVMSSLMELFRKPGEMPLTQHFAEAMRSAGENFARAIVTLACLPYEAWFSLAAITRTAGRLLFTRKRLLEWHPSGDRARESDGGGGAAFAAAWRSMWIAPVIAVAIAVHLALSESVMLAAAAPILCLWFASPAIMWWLSLPVAGDGTRLADEQRLFLRNIARRTWGFFETFVSPEDHWLPPDNYQEQHVAAIAHRTSPTNIGMALLANLSAYDFGYIAAGELVERTARTFNTMETMERYHGHFYNWYDTRSLQPLTPLYISSVDSGNLAGHLLTLRAGLLALPDQPILGAHLFGGLSDTLQLLAGTVTSRSLALAVARLQRELGAVCDAPPTSLMAARAAIDRLVARSEEIAADIAGGGDGGDDVAAATETHQWVQVLVQQGRNVRDELAFLAPWLVLPAADADDDFAGITTIPTLRELAEFDGRMIVAGDRGAGADAISMQRGGGGRLRQLLAEGSARAVKRIAAVDRLVLQAGEFARMDYDFLYDKARHLLSIGYNVGERRPDPSYYDLLASEARLCNFVAIAQGKLPQESWFALGRLLTTAGGEPILLSWSGSMFEYLMPLLVMPTYADTLLDQTCRAVVRRQIEYGRQRGVAWGISESGYNAVDVHLNYQYRAFGVPGLGFKRGLAEDLVIAPYASALALMVAPEAACANLQRLAADGLIGTFGFFEAVDYTPSRLPRGQSRAVVKSFMTHHQGMTLLSVANLLLDGLMQKRFQSDPQFQATVLLLQERVPKASGFYMPAIELSDPPTPAGAPEPAMRVFNSPDLQRPEVQLLSNGRLHVMITHAGGGYSRWNNLMVTRWREDATRDNWGAFCYVRDVGSGAFWSTAHQPVLERSDHYAAIFSEGRAEFRRRDHDFDTHTEIVVSPEDDIELRRVRITNRARTPRAIEVTSYAEVVLAAAAADAQAPAFSNLFVQTEILASRRAILCTRRPRSLGDQVPWMFHLMALRDASATEVSYETDRLQFIGRGNTVASPAAMTGSGALSGSDGSVLDPIVAIRNRVLIEPGEAVTIDIVTGISESRDACLGLVGKYQDPHLADRVFDLAWTHSHVVLRQLNATEADAQLYCRLAGSVLYANASLRVDAGVLRKNRRGQPGLWGYAISGDLPIVLLQIGDSANVDLVRQMVQAHAYWRLKGLAVDLMIWNEDHSGYRQVLHDQIMGLIAAGVEAPVLDRPGGVFVRRAEQIAEEDRILLQTVARAIISDGRGTLADQVGGRVPDPASAVRGAPASARRIAAEAPARLPPRNLLFDNRLGGFTADGREYVITTGEGRRTPAPWVNVLANPQFGTVISESGAAYTWSGNAHEFRLSPWHNDPVSDTAGEAYYLRDEESGDFWSPTPLPSCGTASYVTRHGFGYSVFEHAGNGVRSELRIYVALDAPIKFAALKVRNESGRLRRLSATGYIEWVLGDLQARTGMYVITDIDLQSGALLARNPYNTEFARRVAFFDVDDATRSVTGDRTEFLGRNGTLENPAAMMIPAQLSGRVGPALDPCGAVRVAFELPDDAEREVIFRLGVGQDAEEASQLVSRHRGAAVAHHALKKVQQYWTHTLGTVQVKTPDPALDVLANGWLAYQVLACRLWARSGYYQSGGAFGFRDQLQDVMALVHAEPRLVREHLLRCAGRQFMEGDVQHWWHPPSGRGVRTRCSDDYLWLPLATSRYVATTGDSGVLEESVHFLEGRPVGAEEDSYYDLPGRSEIAASLYEHCKRALLHGLRFGSHGLPLMGSGDWNDGMNLVGIKGRGESIWLAFFLHDVLMRFTDVARLRGDTVFIKRCRKEAARLRQNIERHGWDGEWYRRAYFDDGSPLGSAGNPECRIDSIAQSWSVLSAAGDEDRAQQAMDALDRHLVRRQDALIQLLEPPFDTSDMNPGYIKGYVPGVRENGGQYTHAAIWAAMAFAATGDRHRAWELTAMINPVNHTQTAAAVAIFKTEPYVVAADVYALAPHTGRGGWTWYTGSAGWLYRLIVESLLGLQRKADMLRFAPCLPPDWQRAEVNYRYRETVYRVTITQEPGADAAATVTVDGVECIDGAVVLVDDRREHVVGVRVATVGASRGSKEAIT